MSRFDKSIGMLLKKYDYSSELQKMAVETVVKQAELMAENIGT